MTEARTEAVQEAEFAEVEGQQGETAEDVKVAAELTIQVLEGGGLNLNVNEEFTKLNPQQVEEIVRSVHDRLQEQRIAAQALELLKSKLSF